MDPQTPTSQMTGFACAQADVPGDGSVITRTVNGHSIAIARRSPGEESIVAFDSKCPHMKAPLRFGRVIEGEVVCPWHFLRFDTATGNATSCDKSIMKLRNYPVQIRDGNVYVQTIS